MSEAVKLTRRGRPKKYTEDMVAAIERRDLHSGVMSSLWTPPARCLEPFRYDGEISSAWDIRERVSTLQWFEENVRISARTSDFRGMYSRNNFPYQAGPLEAFDDLDVRQISLQWATQMGKSFLIQNLVCKIADTDPSPMMFACPDDQTAREVATERIIPAAELIPQLNRRLLPEGRRDSYKPDFGDCAVYMAWSGSPSTLGQRSCRYVFCTELSKWSKNKSEEADPADLVRERVKAFWDSKIILEGTPTVEGLCRVEALGKAANQRLKYHIPCPFCGHYQHFVFKQVKWERLNEKNDRDLAERTAYYECIACKGKLDNGHRIAALKSGIWAEEGTNFTEINRDRCGAIYFTTGKGKRRLHFDLSSLYSPVLSLGSVASEFIRSIQGEGQKKLQNFINSWLAETWSQNVREYDWKDLKILRVDTPSGELPPWTAFLTAGIDCGKYCSHYAVRAWGPGGRSRLVSWGVVQNRGEAPDFDALEANLLHIGFGNDGMRISLVGIDSGYKTYDVYSWCLQMEIKYGDIVRPIKGVSKGAPYWMSRQDRSGADGAAIDGGIRLWMVNDAFFKERLTSKYTIPAGSAGAWEVTIDADEVYLRSLVSEVLQERTDAKGFTKYEWVVLDKAIGNHYFDCEKINCAMAEMAGLRDLIVSEDKHQSEIVRGVSAYEVSRPQERERFEVSPEGYWPDE